MNEQCRVNISPGHLIKYALLFAINTLAILPLAAEAGSSQFRDSVLADNEKVSIELKLGTLEIDPNKTWRWGEYYSVDLVIRDKTTKKTLAITGQQLFLGSNISVQRSLLFTDNEITNNQPLRIVDIDSDGVLDCIFVFDQNSDDFRKNIFIVSLNKSGPKLAFEYKFFRQDLGDGAFELKSLTFQKEKEQFQAIMAIEYGGKGEFLFERDSTSGKYETKKRLN